jgi:DNA-directed RNA polymerase specialized sigma24 family protein
VEVNRAEEGDGTFSDLHAQLATLALRTDGKLRSFLRRFERDPQLVDDLVQDVYVEVLKSLRNFGGRSCLESWIFGVAQNVGRQHVAKAVAHRARFVDMEDGPADTRGAPDVLHIVSLQQRLRLPTPVFEEAHGRPLRTESRRAIPPTAECPPWIDRQQQTSARRECA